MFYRNPDADKFGILAYATKTMGKIKRSATPETPECARAYLKTLDAEYTEAQKTMISFIRNQLKTVENITELTLAFSDSCYGLVLNNI